jgi:putative ABC transport system permease protein
VAILSEGLWTRRYGRDRSIVGKSIQINRESYGVAGVIRPILDYRVAANIWMPLAFDPSETAPGTRGPHYIDVIGRLKRGRTIQEARNELGRVATIMVEQYPNQVSMDRGFSIDLEPLAEKQAGDMKTPLLVLIAAVGVLMLIACANVSNLLLAHAGTRRREIGIRSALGASRVRVIRQLLTESLLLASIAGTAGTLLAIYGLHLFSRFGPVDLCSDSRLPSKLLESILRKLAKTVRALQPRDASCCANRWSPSKWPFGLVEGVWSLIAFRRSLAGP